MEFESKEELLDKMIKVLSQISREELELLWMNGNKIYRNVSQMVEIMLCQDYLYYYLIIFSSMIRC